MKDICHVRALNIAKSIADLSQLEQIRLMDGECLEMQGMIYQNLSAFMLASAMKVAAELNFDAERMGQLVDDTIEIAIEHYKQARLLKFNN